MKIKNITALIFNANSFNNFSRDICKSFLDGPTY